MSIAGWTLVFVVGSFALYSAIAIASRVQTTSGFYVAGRGRLRGGQRDGDRGGLDERRLLHLHGGAHLFHGLRRGDLPHGVDRRLRPAGAAGSALPAPLRPLHDPGVRGRPVRLPGRPADRGRLRGVHLLHLRGGADARGRGGFLPVPNDSRRVRRGDRRGHRAALRDARRHAGHHLHPGGPVLRAHRCVPHPRRRHLLDDDRQPDPADRVRLPADRGRTRGGVPAAGDRPDPYGPLVTRVHRSVPRREKDAARCLRDHPGAHDRHRRASARADPFLHGQERAPRPLERDVGAPLHRHPLYDRAGGGGLRPGQHDPDASQHPHRGGPGVVPELGGDRPSSGSPT